MLLIATGGMIENLHPEYLDNAVYPEKSRLEQIMAEAVPGLITKFVEVSMVSGGGITAEYRRIIATEIMNDTDNEVVISHSVDTAGKTVQFIANVLANLSRPRPTKNIVFTDTLTPYAFDRQSSLETMKLAAEAAQEGAGGIYMAMGGLIVPRGEFDYMVNRVASTIHA